MEIYKNPNYSFEERAADLVSRLTLDEKIDQVGSCTSAIPRLGIPAYNYWSEALHGIYTPFRARKMDVTSYPVCLALSQLWDEEAVEEVTAAIADEARAYHNLNGDALHFCCPTINLARDPRNGRSDENFGEDPVLAGKLGASYIRGLQSREGKFLKSIAIPKHYALNSSENNRHRGSSNVDEATLREYYTKVFQYAIREGKAECIMTSYNRVNGVPTSCNEFLLKTLLREEWGYDGFVVSDAGGVGDSFNSPLFGTGVNGHYYNKSIEEACAVSILAGNDVSIGAEHKHHLKDAVEQGLISEADIDRAVIRAFTSRFRLGLFEPKESKPFAQYDGGYICTPEQAAIAVKSASNSIVLLKNDRSLLPLKKEGGKKVLVVGPNAIYRELGGYSAGSMNPLVDTKISVLALEGIRNALKDCGAEVSYEKGWCSGKEPLLEGNTAEMLPGMDASAADLMAQLMELLGFTEEELPVFIASMMGPKNFIPDDPDRCVDNEILMERAVKAAKEADYVIVIAGTDSTNGAEELDRTTLELPYNQNEYILRLLEANENTIVVLTTMGAVTGSFMDKAHTLVNAHFAGQEQGTAIANILFGDVNPNGKLSATWYKNLEDLPHINDYGVHKFDTLDGKGRTYQYFEGEVRFPFGHGLSYSQFDFSNMQVDKKAYEGNDTIRVQVDVTNKGAYDGAEVVELYVSKLLPEKAYDKKPIKQLKAFKKVWLKAGETKTVTLEVKACEITFWNYRRKKMIVEPGNYRIELGRSSADIACSQEVALVSDWNAGLSTVYAITDKNILKPGQTASITTSVTLEDTTHLQKEDYTVCYSSSNPSVLSVNESGKITANACGAASVIVEVAYQGQVKSTRVPFSVN